MIPNKIKPFFENISQKSDGDNDLIEGKLICCNSNCHELYVCGDIKYGFFSKMYLSGDNNQIVLVSHCKKCNNVITIFNSDCDGYDNCKRKPKNNYVMKEIHCKKCNNNNFDVQIKYEYPVDCERDNKDNSFTWIWITLLSNDCGAKYKRFIDFECS